MTTAEKQYINTVATYATKKGLTFKEAAIEYRAMNEVTLNTISSYCGWNNMQNKTLRDKAIRAIATEVYNKINGL